MLHAMDKEKVFVRCLTHTPTVLCKKGAPKPKKCVVLELDKLQARIAQLRSSKLGNASVLADYLSFCSRAPFNRVTPIRRPSGTEARAATLPKIRRKPKATLASCPPPA